MKKAKKLLSLALVLTMCLSLVNLSALAADAHTHDDNCPLCAAGQHEPGDICDCCGYGDKDKNPKPNPDPGETEKPKECEHEWITIEVKPGSCTEQGTEEWLCKKCGDKKVTFCTKLDHTYVDGKCKYCGQEEPKPECVHNNTEIVVVGGPICTEPEYKVTKCKDCGKELSKEQCPFPGKHEYDDGTCKYCGQNEPKVEHTHTLEYCGGTPATCELTGMQGSWFCTGCGEHFWDAEGTKSANKDDLTIPTLDPVFGDWKDDQNGLTQTRVCVNCNGSVKGHSETQPIPKHTHTLEYCGGTPATCELTGMQESWYCTECGEHFLDAEGTKSANKDDLTIPARGHDFSMYEKHDEKTHTYKCSRCSETRDYDHVLSKHTILKQPTCTEPGLEEFVCKDENCNWTNKNEIPALGHDLKWCEGEEQSCFAAGRRGYWYCERCNKGFLGDNGTGEFTDKDLLAIPGMDADYSGQKWEPYSDTQHKMVCKNCNGVAEKHTEYAEHKWSAWYPVDGSTTHHVRECEDCGAKQEAEHHMGEWVIGKVATVDEEGSRHRVCADCGYTEYETIARLPGETSGGGNNNGGNNNDDDDDGTDIPDTTPPQGGGDNTPNPPQGGGDTTPPTVDVNEEQPPLVEIPKGSDPIESAPAETDISDEQPPLADEVPEIDIPAEETPLVYPELVPEVTVANEDTPLVGEVTVPEEDTPLVDIADLDVPMVGVPQTGDISLAWYGTAILSLCGLAFLTLKKREGESEED